MNIEQGIMKSFRNNLRATILNQKSLTKRSVLTNTFGNIKYVSNRCSILKSTKIMTCNNTNQVINGKLFKTSYTGPLGVSLLS